MTFNRKFSTFVAGAVAALALALAPPAVANEPVSGVAVEAVHGEGGHEEGKAEAGEHEVSFTADDNKNGTPNWRDSEGEGKSENEAYVLRNLAVQAGNLLLFVIVVGLLARRPLKDALGNREIAIRKAIADASDAHAAAQAKSEQVSRRLDALDAEIAKMKSDARAQIVEEEQKLVQRAQEEAARIAETAQRNIREELDRARTALRKEAVDLAVAAAEETLRKQVHPSDQRRLAKSFLESLGDARG